MPAPAKRFELFSVLDDLVADGMLDPERAKTFKSVSAGMVKNKNPLIEIADHHWNNEKAPGTTLTLEVLSEWCAKRFGLPYFRFDPLKMDVTGITTVMAFAYAERYNIIAVRVDDTSIDIATGDPLEMAWEQELERITHKRINRVFANPVDIQRYLVEFYSMSRSVIAAREDEKLKQVSGVQNLEQLMEMGKAGKLDANDSHIVSIVDWVLAYAYEERASDIHLEPRREMGNVRFRIDGVMHQVYEMPAAVMVAVSSRIKILGRMDVSEKRRPQDGRLKTRTPSGQEIELRLSTMPTAFGEKLVMRIFDPEVLVKDFEALGFTRREREQWQGMIREPNGIILVTGPTGSGKTTTLYTTLKELAQPEVNVCTVEDPIELIEPSFNQMQVQHNIDLDFASGVKTLLRQDPDIIMIGEIRDRDTAEMAIQASLTGHLVFSTLHTNDAPSAITRLQEIGVPAYLIKATLLGVLGQRLVRTLCPHCKEPVELKDELWESLTRPWKTGKPQQAHQAVGCLECRMTGYKGRVGIYEMMTLNDKLRGHIGSELDVTTLRKAAIKEGMKPLRINGAEKISRGLTTVEEVLKVAPPESLLH